MEVIKDMVSVVMSNYNTPERYLRQSIESVLNQTYKFFEFLIIDDGSTDDSLEVIKSYDDTRIRIIENGNNLGITKSLNKGLLAAKGEYIARMDADDICYPDRFEKQVSFLKSHSEHIVCGTWIEQIGDNGELRTHTVQRRKIPKRKEYQVYLLFGNYPNIVHPTAMFNHSLLLKHQIKYDERYPLAQDYRMWVECSKYGECAHLPQVLLQYRIHEKAVSEEKKDIQMNYTKQIIEEQLSWLHIELPKDWKDVHLGFLTGRKVYNLRQKNWVKEIIRQNKLFGVFSHKELVETYIKKWAEISYFELRNGSLKNKVKVIVNLPIMCFIEMFRIKKIRMGKGNDDAKSKK